MKTLIDAEEIASVEKLLEKLEDDDDVLNVFHNMQLED
jgi:transcriptional/translational regulatory protein YebC/TACO1